MQAPIQAVIFDNDGTLVDSEAAGLDVVHALATEAGLPLSLAEVQQRFRGVRMAVVARELAQRLRRPAVTADPMRPAPACRAADAADAVNEADAADAALATEFEAKFLAQVRPRMAERFAKGVAALPGAAGLLQRLRAPFAVATNGPREKAEQTLQLAGLRPWVGAHLYCAYEIGHFKPAPGLFLHAAHALGVAPARCAVVEDSLPGVQAGLAAGMQVYALHASSLPAEVQAQVQALQSLDDLLTLWEPLGLLHPA